MIPFIKRTLLYPALFAPLLLLGSGCGAPLKTSNNGFSSTRPEWIYNHPTSANYLIGVGSARIGKDLAQSQEQARTNALKDITQQINITINTHQKYIQKDSAEKGMSAMIDTTNTDALAKLQGDWKETDHWLSPDSLYWCEVFLDREKYDHRVNKKFYDAIALASDALTASDSGPFVNRVQELYKGMTALDSFSGAAIKGNVGGREIILNSELPRKLRQLLSSVVLQPNAPRVELPAVSSSIPDTFGIRVFIDGQPDSSVAVTWASSTRDFQPVGMGARENGLRVVSLKKFPASAGTGTISATINIGSFAYDLLQRKFSLSSGSFIVSRRSPRIYASATTPFCNQLIERLTSTSAAILASGPDSADFTIVAQCKPQGEIINDGTFYRAKASLTLAMTTRNGIRVLDVTKPEPGADWKSADVAMQNAEETALDEAVKMVVGGF